MNLQPRLTGDEVEQLQEALLGAFSLGELKQLVFTALDTQLDNIVAVGRPFRETVFELVLWADRHNKVRELLETATKANSGNAALRLAADAILADIDAPAEASIVQVPDSNPLPANSVRPLQLETGCAAETLVFIATHSEGSKERSVYLNRILEAFPDQAADALLVLDDEGLIEVRKRLLGPKSIHQVKNKADAEEPRLPLDRVIKKDDGWFSPRRLQRPWNRRWGCDWDAMLQRATGILARRKEAMLNSPTADELVKAAREWGPGPIIEDWDFEIRLTEDGRTALAKHRLRMTSTSPRPSTTAGEKDLRDAPVVSRRPGASANRLGGAAQTGKKTKRPIRRKRQMPAATKRFRVALSFPGEYRTLVAAVADEFACQLGKDRVLYDRFYEAELARPDLDTYLQLLYHDESDLVVVFLCAEYERKEWCGLEWRAIRDLIKKKQTSAIMLCRFDDTLIPGSFSIDGYVSLASRPAQDVAALILERLSVNDAQNP